MAWRPGPSGTARRQSSARRSQTWGSASHVSPIPANFEHGVAVIIARHLDGESNRKIAREEEIDRETVDRILTQQELVAMIAEQQTLKVGSVLRVGRSSTQIDFPFDSAIRYQPHQGDEHVQSGGDPWTHKSEWDSGEIKHSGEFTLPIRAKSPRHKGVATFLGNDSPLENKIGDSCHQQNETIYGGRNGS
jgi:hypothetical protein